MKVTYQFKVVLERKHYQKSWIVHIRVCSEDFIFTEKKTSWNGTFPGYSRYFRTQPTFVEHMVLFLSHKTYHILRKSVRKK